MIIIEIIYMIGDDLISNFFGKHKRKVRGSIKSKKWRGKNV